MKNKITLPLFYIVFGLLFSFSCKKEDEVQLPSLTTSAISNINNTTATCGGNITKDGGAEVIARGVCWSMNQNPTIENNKTNDGTGTGNFTSNIVGLIANTKYYIKAYSTNSVGTAYGNEIIFTSANFISPVVTTTLATSISLTKATINGNVSSDGGIAITERGFCYGTSINPTIANTKIIVAGAEGVFNYNLTGLNTNTTYHIRAYAINSIGISYGNDIFFSTAAPTITDYDGNIYNVIEIGNQVWMAENLKVSRYRNGDIISTTTPATIDIRAEDSPKYQWASSGNENNVGTYGRLYTWYTVTDSRGLCPIGFHVPSEYEWSKLEGYLVTNGYNYNGTTTGNLLAKALVSNTLWTYSSVLGSAGNTDYPSFINKSGFTALPSGVRWSSGSFSAGNVGSWWSSSEYFADVWSRSIYSQELFFMHSLSTGNFGRAVRCILD